MGGSTFSSVWQLISKDYNISKPKYGDVVMKKLTKEQFIEKSNLRHNHRYDYSNSIYINKRYSLQNNLRYTPKIYFCGQQTECYQI